MESMVAVERWLDWCTETRRLRVNTVQAYGKTLRPFTQWLTERGWSGDWADVTAEQIEDFVRRDRIKLGRPQPPAASTQDRDRVAINVFMRWCINRGFVQLNPVVDVGVPKVRNRLPKAVPDATWQQFWASDIPAEDRVWLGLACFVGLRRFELVRLRPSQVDTARGILIGLERKGGFEDAIEYRELAHMQGSMLPQILPDADEWVGQLEWLAQFRRSDRTLITLAPRPTRSVLDDPDPLVPQEAVVNDRLVTLIRRAGMPHRLFAPHALRHTCATNLLRCGLPIEVVADVLGHSSIDTTRRYLKTAGRLSEWRRQTGGR